MKSKIDSILEVIESNMNFRLWDGDIFSVSEPWKFIEFSGNDLIVENPFGEIETKPVEFIENFSWLEVKYLDFTIINTGIHFNDVNSWCIIINEKNIYFDDLEDMKNFCLKNSENLIKTGEFSHKSLNFVNGWEINNK